MQEETIILKINPKLKRMFRAACTRDYTTMAQKIREMISATVAKDQGEKNEREKQSANGN